MTDNILRNRRTNRLIRQRELTFDEKAYQRDLQHKAYRQGLEQAKQDIINGGIELLNERLKKLNEKEQA